jgi:UDP-N-acetylmuramoyl-tripeptide--D-alanyl-D-alanine ligase
METITLGQLLKAVDGTLLGGFCDLNAPIGRVDTDSRSIHLGSLFVPLAGARFDGHAYLNSAPRM